ncbi:hypothetical protein L1049_022393 [Liquidambar formosana]|uniref:Uncharacterized protein n=1 Tax=Liquidambar formosana TaxID=63359 RepID=A0AAP0RCC9_LIQFO
MKISDKIGGRPVASLSTSGLSGIVDSHGLIDLGYAGNPYTWNNMRSSFANIREHLDRGFANSEWRLLFPHATLLYLLATASDHYPILINSLCDGNLIRKPFKFYAMWIQDSSSSLVVEHAWRSYCLSSPSFRLCHKIKLTRFALSRWNKDHFGSIYKKIRSLIASIDSL